MLIMSGKYLLFKQIFVDDLLNSFLYQEFSRRLLIIKAYRDYLDSSKYEVNGFLTIIHKEGLLKDLHTHTFLNCCSECLLEKG